MQKVVLFTILLCFGVVANALPKSKSGGKQWALLIAGSNGFYNYRHQADVCHAYHVLNKHGIPDENIVVMMYDDIAHNTENPTPGIIINHPDGKDVYAGVPKDYTKKEVTPENFLAILQGKKPKGGSGKVINSGPDDHVFVYFSDHGGTGLIAFPNGILTVKALNDALTNMHKEKRFGQLVFYLEACESGSMFKNILPVNMNIYATTAADFNESSYACYYDNERGTYLGDHYSVNWLEDSDKKNIETETLKMQFQLVKKETNDSHCQEYGQLNIADEPVGEFQGSVNPSSTKHDRHLRKVPYDGVPSDEVPIYTIYRRMSVERDEAKKSDLLRELNEIMLKRRFINAVVDAVVYRLTNATNTLSASTIKKAKIPLTKFACHDVVTNAFHDFCFHLSENPYAIRFVRYFANICEFAGDADKVVAEMRDVCSFPRIVGAV